MSFRLQDILSWIPGRLANAEALGDRASEIAVNRMAALKGSGPSDVAFFFAREFQNEIPDAHAGILITGEPFVGPLQASGLPIWKTTAIVASPDPYRAMALISARLADGVSTVAHLPGKNVRPTKIHPSAVIDPGAKIGEGVQIGPHCVVEKDVSIGARTVLYPGCYVGPGARLGEDCVLFPNVVIYEWTEIGNRVRLHSGTMIGVDGFGYAPIVEGGVPKGHEKIYHLGKVVIEDDVEIGANTTVDRATFGETRIGAKTKIDNGVQIGHNTTVGEGAIFCGAAGTAGSAKVGRYVYIGGMSGISNKVELGDGAKVAAMSGVSRDLKPGEVVAGVPQREYQEHFKVHALLNKLLKEKRRGKS